MNAFFDGPGCFQRLHHQEAVLSSSTVERIRVELGRLQLRQAPARGRLGRSADS